METSKEPGELGRRVAHRRLRLGLSRAQVARRARMPEGYIRHIEEQPAEVDSGALWRLAAALETTPRQLLGSSPSPPVSERRPDEAGATTGR
ncbi:MAG TPA: helix-turn-helix transcriptional regulator [Jiangellaceae bacterium]|nr:helix-turn-helix transcriptional regulator [Jiangellaceae bacterium]